MRFPTMAALGLILAGCAGTAAVPAIAPAGPPHPPQSADTGNPTAAPPTPTGPREWPELNQAFEAERVTGTIALFDSQDGVLGCSNLKKCQAAVTPASTFKIPHSMVALETGVVEGPDTIMPWNHQTFTNEDWNQDLKFRDAFRLSCVPCYRAIARKLGDATEQEWLNKLGYGNRSIEGGVDKFWLGAGLRISALEQIDFLRRFDGDKLPISSRTADLVRDIMTIDVTESYVLRGKTGSALPPDEPQETLWFVGWLELGERRVFFATLLDGHSGDVDPLRVRRSVTERILKSKGWM
ncbi:MAG TPA: penicillin-binding transpeptidase domain-containing protein [Polyangiaceae bacterium]|nr:penicillin-binding transpeptidase domain-containing protein [Polyangiaceae bacterium]